MLKETHKVYWTKEILPFIDWFYDEGSTLFYTMFSKGHLSDTAYRRLIYFYERNNDYLAAGYPLSNIPILPEQNKSPGEILFRSLAYLPLFSHWSARRQARLLTLVYGIQNNNSLKIIQLLEYI